MKTVLIFGTFDIVHLGHIDMFRQAREYGDRLVAVLARDKNVSKIKNIQTMHTEQERKEFLECISLIDEVYLGSEIDPYDIIEKIQPDVIALGYDQKVFVDKLEHALAERGITAEIVRLKEYDSSKHKSAILKQYISKSMSS